MLRITFKLIYSLIFSIVTLYPLMSFAAWTWVVSDWAAWERLILLVGIAAPILVFASDIFNLKKGNAKQTIG